MRLLWLSALAIVYAQETVENQYIVTFNNDTDIRGNMIKYLNFVRDKIKEKDQGNRKLKSNGTTTEVPQALHVYNFTNYKGMSIKLPKGILMKLADLDCDFIRNVEQDKYVHLEEPEARRGVRSPPSSISPPRSSSVAATSSRPPPISSASPPRSSSVVATGSRANPTSSIAAVLASPTSATSPTSSPIPYRIPLYDATSPQVLSTQQSPPSWGLRRLSSRTLPLGTLYTYPNNGANGTFAYVIDTGVWLTHDEFKTRIINGPNYSTDVGTSNDLNGHGTHVAGIIAGTTTGVAKNATIVAIKVMNAQGSGTVSNVIAALNWAVNDARTRRGNGKLRAVANLSLSAAVSTSLNSAVQSAVENGLVVVVAAGNKNTTSCSFSPASEPMAITVGATQQNDARASFSNYGSCVDIFAPGQSILSSYGKNGTTTDNVIANLSGTSMAAPHVAGVALLAMGSNDFRNATHVIKFVKDQATVGVVTNTLDSPNLLAFNQ